MGMAGGYGSGLRSVGHRGRQRGGGYNRSVGWREGGGSIGIGAAEADVSITYIAMELGAKLGSELGVGSTMIVSHAPRRRIGGCLRKSLADSGELLNVIDAATRKKRKKTSADPSA